jgi:tetratricopeptide (TPR) repeat protein
LDVIASLTLVEWAAVATIVAAVFGVGGFYYTRMQAKKPLPPEPTLIAGDQASMPAPPLPLPPPPKINLPPATHFVERKDLMDKVLQAVAPRQGVSGPRTAVISALHGMGGIGKTELAREAARRLNCPGGTAEVNLRGWDSKEPMEEAEALRALSRRLKNPAPENASPDDLRTHWREITSGRQCLVILDNLSDASLIEHLRPTDGITLVTTRTRNLVLGVPGIDVGVMEAAEAAALARQNCPSLSEADALHLAKLTGYLPLAVEIAAQRLNDTGESVAALEARLADPAMTATVLKGETPEEDVLLRVLQWSLAGLPPSQVADWQALSLAPGDLGPWTVRALWQTEDPVEGLRTLVRRNLLTRLEGQERWRLHDVLRRFALAALLAGPDREQALWRQLGTAAVRRLEGIDARFQKGHDDMVPALAELDAELPLLRAVQEWAAERIEADAVAAAVASELPNHSVTQFRLVGDEVLAWRQMSLHAAEHRGEQAEIARAAGNLGLVHRQRGELEEALAMLRRVREIAEADGDKVNMARTYGNLGLVHGERGEWEEALAMHRKALGIYEEYGDQRGMALNYGNLGLVHHARGEWEEALAMHRKSLAIEEELGDRAGMAAGYGNLGLVHQERGEWEEALAGHRKALGIYEELGDRAGVSRNVYNLGNVLKDQGDWAGAAEHFRRSLTLAEELGMPDDRIQNRRRALAEAEAHLAGSKGSP